ncbi:phage tail protein [Enterobacter roggenkampii]|uniref:tail fiber assembly protein n=1 Tax=Enterobacter roggenkampii TaxID=1812935 RepID=UPI000B3B0DB5|nr:tail fiber assembly protein [Enterobacter roggenkampii]OUR39426.1 phage tail protein [Enterobacter roggenkampii]
MVDYKYSKETNGFYVDGVSEFIPQDVVSISVEKYNELMLGQSQGKEIAADKDGNPVLLDPPAATKEQLIIIAEAKRASLMAGASVAISPLQDAVDLGDSTPEEEALLKKLKQYRVELNRLDISKAPDISWPVKPA